MFIRLCLRLLLVIIFALPLFGLKEEGADGLVLGHDAAFKVTAPVGWIFDNESCQPYHTQAFIYPSGKKWDGKDTTIIWGDVESWPGRTLDDVIAMNKNLTPQEFPALATSDGRSARVREFAKERIGRVAYIGAPGAVCELTLLAPDRASLERAVPVFEEVVKSFRFFGPDSGEYLGGSGAQSILRRTTEIQDTFTYRRPDGWNQESGKPGVTIFKRAVGNAYGLIAVYSAKPSAGSPEADYEAAWNEVARSAFAVGPAPVPQLRTHEGCQVRIGRAVVKDGQRQSTAMLTVFSGWGKRTSILTSFNDQSFIPDVENFLKSFEPDYTLKAIVGWTGESRGPQEFVDGKLVNLSADGYASRCYSFRETTYEFQSEVKLSADQYVLLNETGTYSLNGNKLTLISKGGTQRKLDREGRATATRSLPAWSRTYTYKLVGIEGAIHGPYLVLGGVEANGLDGCYSDFFPNSFVYVLGYHPDCRFQQF